MSVIKKMFAIFSIFTLTITNFVFVGKVYAATLLESVFSNSLNAEANNIEFDAYFEDTEKNKSYSVFSNVNEDDVNLSINLAIQNFGYLKNSIIEIKPKDDDSKLNFKVKGKLEESDFVKSFENNKIVLKQINKNSAVNLQIPLTYAQEEYIQLSKLSQDFIVQVTGTYVNSKAEEKNISKQVMLRLTWIDKRELSLTSEVKKYFQYSEENENGMILQTLVKVDSKAQKSGAVKSTKLEIEVPKIEGAETNILNIEAISTKGTNGKEYENVDFSNENIKYENNNLTIYIENKPQLVEISNNEETNTLLEEKELEKKEMYYSFSGADEYLITYKIKNVANLIQNVSSKAKATVTTFGIENIENIKEETFQYNLLEEISKPVSYEVQNKTESISKGYTYYNIENSIYEIQYNSKAILNISNKDIVDEIYIKDTTSYYIDKENLEHELTDIYYKEVSISKNNFDKILGEDGFIEIQRQDGTIIAKITKIMELDENSNYIFKFDEYSIDKINIKTSKPIQNGNLLLNIVKVQKDTNYSKEEFSNFNNIELSSEAGAKYTGKEEIADSGGGKITVNLEDTKTKASLELSTNKISTEALTNIQIKIKLNNDKIESDIFGNSIFEILLPENIEQFEITDYNIIYGEGLNIADVETTKNEQDRILVKAILEGKQLNLSPGTITEGTNLVFNSNIKANINPTLSEEQIELNFENSEATNYENEAKDIQKVKFIFSEEEDNIEIIDLGEEDTAEDSSITQEIKSVQAKKILAKSENVLNTGQISGCIWLDENKNGIRESVEKMKQSNKVCLVDADTKVIKQEQTTDSDGKYTFKELKPGNYFIVFEYDESKYKTTKYQAKQATLANDSDVITTSINQDEQKSNVAITDVIVIDSSEAKNIDMGLVKADIFDLELTNTISKITIQNKLNTNIKEYNNSKLAKVEILDKKLSSSKVYIEYKIKVTNKGDVEGYAKKIVDYIPKDLIFEQELNPNWYQGSDNNLYSTALAKKPLAKGKSEEIDLVLTKVMTEENTGLVNNTAEISEDYNSFGLSDINSKAGNKVQTENDYGSADVLIAVKTGRVFIYTSVTFTTVLLGGIVVFIIVNTMKLKKKKGRCCLG